ncbi:MAG: type 4a pilus biogenesis protein PilO [Candidatus Saccharimonadia bacterium]
MKAQQFFYISLGILAALLIGGGAGYYYATGIIHSQTTTLAQTIANESVAEDQISQLISMKRQYEKLVPLLPEINAALPSDKNETEAALQLEQLATNAGMILPSVNFQAISSLPNATSQTVAAGSALALPVSFQLSGTYPQLQTFLQSLENLSRFSAVTNLTISLRDEKTQTLNFNLQVNMYFKP